MRPLTSPSPLLFSIFLATTGAVPLVAQRVDVSSRRTPRVESDSTERLFRRLQARADSLTRVFFNEGAEVDDRRRAGEALDETVAALAALGADGDGGRVMMFKTPVPRMLAPFTNPRAAQAMSRALNRSAAPRGWLGIVVSGAAREPWVERGELFVRYLTHPEIVSVEPSSPADSAGLVPSDTLIAYDGRDVTAGDISITRLLKPNARVLVRIRRDGRTRDVPVRIADVPQRIAIRVDRTWVDGAPTPLPQAPSFRDMRAPLPPMPPSYARRPSPAVAPVAPVGVYTLPSGVAGAQITTVTAGIARAIAWSGGGGFVVTAPVGSPAAQSGLAEGDVIVAAAGQAVRTVSDLRELVGAAADRGEHSIELETVRAKQKRKITLRW